MLRPTLQAVCGSRFPAPLRYGDPISAGRVQRREVVISKRGARGVVVGRTAPVEPTLGALARGRSSELCGTGYLVEVNGRAVAANARKVRELNRTPREPCPVHVQADAPTLRALMREAERLAAEGEVAHPWELLGDLPWPHHAGSGPCCGSSANTPGAVLSRFEPWATGRAAARQVAAARKTIPAALRGSVKVRSLDDVPGAMRQVQTHCFEQVKRWVEVAETPRREKYRATKRAVRVGYPWKGSRSQRK